MHTLAGKPSARERELAPRFYYKRSNTSSCTQKIKNFFRTLLTFMFTQVIIYLVDKIKASLMNLGFASNAGISPATESLNLRLATLKY